MTEFANHIKRYYNVSQESIDLFLSKTTEVVFDKKELFLQKDDNNNFVFFVKDGLTRSFVLPEGKDNTVWFSKAGEPVVMSMGTVCSAKTVIYAETLERSVLLKIKRTDLEKLFTMNLELCNWGRRLADTFLCELETVLTRDLCSSANDRYENLVSESPELLQRVPLKYVASYLLVTPESLSRIRRNLGK